MNKLTEQKTDAQVAHEAEVNFLNNPSVVKAGVTAIREVDTMLKAYEDMLMGLVKLKINIQILTSLCLLHPDNQELFKKKEMVEKDIEVNTNAVAVMRQQIIEKCKLENEKN